MAIPEIENAVPALGEISIANSPASLIRIAVSGNADLDKLAKLLDLQERWEAAQSKKAFAVAFAQAQANVTSVTKNRLNPQTHSKYADLANVIEETKPAYTKEGFSIIFYEGSPASPENMRICADVFHQAGHKETYYYDVPLDGVGIKGSAYMTKIHAKASSTSYGRRYLMCMIWNIPTQDDNDGNGPIQMPQAKESAPPTPAKHTLPKTEKSAFEIMLKSFAQAKKVLGEKLYYEFLGGAGLAHANEIKNLQTGEALLAIMRQEAIRKKNGVM